MKRTYINFVLILVFIMMMGCDSKNYSKPVRDGEYLMELAKVGLPYIKIIDGKIDLGDMTSSMFPNGVSGTYSVNNNRLTMITDSKCIYVFQIDGDNLIFLKNESSPDESIRIKITDKAKFHLK